MSQNLTKAKAEKNRARRKTKGGRGWVEMSYRSEKRNEKRRLKAEYGITSGRQWVRLRKALQRAIKAAERARDERTA